MRGRARSVLRVFKRSLGEAAAIMLVAACPVLSAYAGFDEGMAAYERGDYAAALEEWRALAEEGHPAAQFWVGHMYRTGLTVEKDMEEAIRWFRRAAKQQEPMAEYILGVLYYQGDGVPKDIREAVGWFRLAAEHGDIEALDLVGQLYTEGEWRPRDEAGAREWYLKVVESHRLKEGVLSPDAHYTLGLIYKRGGLIPVQPSQSQSWFKKAFDRYLQAAARGDRHAQCMLYYMFHLGQGVPRNDEMAEFWFMLAQLQKRMFTCIQEAGLVEQPIFLP